MSNMGLSNYSINKPIMLKIMFGNYYYALYIVVASVIKGSYRLWLVIKLGILVEFSYLHRISVILFCQVYRNYYIHHY